MRNIPVNVWSKRLKIEDWNFSQCPSEEHEVCLNWELRREQSQFEAGGILLKSPLTFIPTGEDLRLAAVSSHISGGHPVPAVRGAARQISSVPKGWILHPDFPQFSYLEMRTSERWKRIESTEPANWVWLDGDWHRLICEMPRAEWEEILCASLPIWVGGTLNVEVCPLKIPWSWRDEDIIEAFGQWLQERRPKGDDWDCYRPRVDEPPPKEKKKGGAGDPIRQAKARLKALAAWRLIQHYGGNNWDAYRHPGAMTYLGKQFDKPGAWSEARAVVRKASKKSAESLEVISQKLTGRFLLDARPGSIGNGLSR